jgi:hypothetical protein
MKYRISAVIVASLMVVAAGCGKNNNGTTNNGDTNSSANGDTNSSANGDTNSSPNGDTNSSANGDTTGGDTTGTNNATTFGPFGSCDEGGLTECFANEECQADERCQDVGGGVEVPCCVPGERGTKATGDECASENECASGVCIGRNDDPEICSEDCGDDMMCPDDLECVEVPFTGGSGMWCVTASQ